jgi:hypothetical protein
LFTPGLTNDLHTTQVTNIITNTINRGDNLYVVDLGTYGNSVSSIITQAQSRDTSYAASYFPWIRIIDPGTGKHVWAPASTVIPGVYAFNDKVAAPWFAPAGINRGGLNTVLQAQYKLSQANKDTLYDKYNKSGYLIQRDKYYIFQPFNDNEDITMYYRQHTDLSQQNQVSINNYVKQKFAKSYKKQTDKQEDIPKEENNGYNYEDTFDYYNDRNENFIVGIIDKNTNKLSADSVDLFKIRPPRSKNVDKKRGVGIPTFKGAVCSTSKDKEYLIKLIKKIPNISNNEITRINKLKRENICLELKDKLLHLEKYATTKDDNKVTYVMVPYDHPTLPFPYNLEDRIKHYIKVMNKAAGKKIDLLVKKQKDTDVKYELILENDKYSSEFIDAIKQLGFKLNKDTWTYLLQ